MDSQRIWLILGALAAAIVTAVLAISSTVSYVSGPPRPFEQLPVSADERQAIESLVHELLALDTEARRAQIGQLIGSEAPAGHPRLWQLNSRPSRKRPNVRWQPFMPTAPSSSKRSILSWTAMDW